MEISRVATANKSAEIANKKGKWQIKLGTANKSVESQIKSKNRK
ncbi:hypothetical protein [Gottfriedia luciferensis]|nr:hypothetical protein [Gottfriedia luciferensis]